MSHARQRNLLALQLRHVGVIVVGRAQLVVTALEEADQAFEEFAGSGGLDVVLQLQVLDTAAQQHVEVLVVDQLEALAGLVEQRVAVRMKRTDLQSGVRNLRDGCRVVRSLPETRDALEQVARRIARVRDRKNLFGIGELVFDQAHHAAGQHRGLARPRASDGEDWSLDVVYGLLLLRRKFEFAGLPGHGLVLLSSIEEKAKLYYPLPRRAKQDERSPICVQSMRKLRKTRRILNPEANWARIWR